ncbi:MAG TPA: hypothetical protein PK668_24565 [Myxococcota bacterium]|nr:hypothetical protein [Myxococcota bacterium]HRY96887.1 hypothetical protein [Myxococcota bacterium]HSA24691.1 hypothetical protein [Myxococcota bacterium]
MPIELLVRGKNPVTDEQLAEALRAPPHSLTIENQPDGPSSLWRAGSNAQVEVVRESGALEWRVVGAEASFQLLAYSVASALAGLAGGEVRAHDDGKWIGPDEARRFGLRPNCQLSEAEAGQLAERARAGDLAAFERLTSARSRSARWNLAPAGSQVELCLELLRGAPLKVARRAGGLLLEYARLNDLDEEVWRRFLEAGLPEDPARLKLSTRISRAVRSMLEARGGPMPDWLLQATRRERKKVS